MERKKQNGLLERLSAVIISRVKTVRASISEYLSSRKIARLLTLTMMCVLSLTSVGVLLLGIPSLSSSAVVDYSLPFQSVGRIFTARIASPYLTTVNDWKESSFTRSIPQDVDLSSFTISACATDNYGTDFAIWLTIIDNNNRYLYNSGWKTGGINYDYIPMYEDTSSITTYFRIRYIDGEGINPPSSSMYTAIQAQINFLQYVQTSEQTALPPEWTATTTAVNTDIPVTALTTTTYINWDEQVSGNNGFFETLRYSVSTLFGIGDSWESAVYVMNYMNDRLPYVFAISAFCGMVGIAVWFLEK